jgi:hypothetical protein
MPRVLNLDKPRPQAGVCLFWRRRLEVERASPRRNALPASAIWMEFCELVYRAPGHELFGKHQRTCRELGICP